MQTRAGTQQSGGGTAISSTTSTAEASKMLEAALQQMDGIINGAAAAASGGTATASSSASTSDISSLTERNLISASNVLSTATTLALALQQVGCAAPAPDAVSAAIIGDWLETHIPRQDTDERLRRLQRDKEALAVQLQLSSDNVAAQSQRIAALERQLSEKSQQLDANEQLLQRQMLSRSALETQQLELLSALSELKLHRAALERENVELKECSSASSPLSNSLRRQQQRLGAAPPPFGSVGSNLNQLSLGGIVPPKTPPTALRHQIQPQFHSLPRSHATKLSLNNNNNSSSSSGNKPNGNHNRAFDANANAAQRQRNVAFASNEKILIDDGAAVNAANESSMYSSFMSNSNSTPSPNLRERSAKGLRNIFGKLRRSNSGNLELPALEQADALEFRRGGARATAGGRIEWSTQSSTSSSKGYADWTPQEVCNWLCDLGLGCYVEDCRKWLDANASVCFFTASPPDIERELSLKTPLHRKKILLAIDKLTGKEDDVRALQAGTLDSSWVLRWLDDIGLPQYKDNFLQAKLDGRMLHRLTMEDLAQLHVTSCLHIASLRSGIQCMRETGWNPECLIRRSTTTTQRQTSGGGGGDDDDINDDLDAEGANATTQSPPPECVALWTAHRVMEWLRVADLAEYAPNLRGAGVHGALMMYEARFNANLLADLLSIPPSKTLLRRHLATHFKELIGYDCMQAKRVAETTPGYQPLTIAAKLKPPKKTTQFLLKRRKSTKAVTGTTAAVGSGGGGGSSNEIEWTDYVCPMTTATTTLSTTTTTTTPMLEEHNTSTTSSTSTNNSCSMHSN